MNAEKIKRREEIMIKYKKYVFLPEYGTNTYLIWDTESKEALLVDMAAPSKKIFSELKDWKLKYLVNTHGHADHIGGNKFIKDNFEVKLMIHQSDVEMLSDAQKNLSSFMGAGITSPSADIIVTDGDKFKLGNTEFKIIHTPGHTKGGICLLFDKIIVTGDTLFNESIGRTDFPGGSFTEIKNSIQKKLFILDEKLIVLPGHNNITTIGDEKIGNPFVGLNANSF